MMDGENLNLEEQCEYVMNSVVESRKVYGKLCKSYEEKCLQMQKKLLGYQLETISKFNFKPKHQLPNIDYETMCQDTEVFTKEILTKQKRIEELKKNIITTQEIVLQLKNDKTNKKLTGPFNTETLLARAKNKEVL